MKLTIIGGGGFRVPQIFEALSAGNGSVRITQLCLFDSHPARVAAIEHLPDGSLLRTYAEHSAVDGGGIGERLVAERMWQTLGPAVAKLR